MKEGVKPLDSKFCRLALLMLAQHDRDYLAREGLKVNRWQQKFLHSYGFHQCGDCLGIKEREEVSKKHPGEWHSNCKNCQTTNANVYYHQNKEEVNNRRLENYEKHRASISARMEKYNRENKDWINGKRKIFRQQNPGYRNEESKEWRSNNRDKVKANSSLSKHKRRTLMQKQHIPYTSIDFQMRMNLFIDQCCYCKKHLEPQEKTVDHCFPISKGGYDEKDNLLPCCLSCNINKRAKNWVEWFLSKPFYDEERKKEIAFHVKNAISSG